MVQVLRPPTQVAPEGGEAARWVLVVDGSAGQNRSAVEAVRALAVAGYRVAVTVSGPDSLAAASRFCSRVVPTPLAGQPGFAAAVRAETTARTYLAVLPASDTAIIGLSAPGQHLVDKDVLAATAAEAGLCVPASRRFDTAQDLLAAADELEYPCVVKAAFKASARQRPAQRIDSAGGLSYLQDETGPFVVQPFLSGEMHSTVGVMWRGRMRAAVHQRHLRLWPPVCGDACAAVTTAPDQQLEEKLERLMADYDGVFQAEFVGPHLLDLNPRVYASLPLATSAGVNLLGIYCALLRGDKVQKQRGKACVGYRWWEGDARHFLWRYRQRQPLLSPALRELSDVVRARALQPSDPGPALTRLRYVFARHRHRAELPRTECTSLEIDTVTSVRPDATAT